VALAGLHACIWLIGSASDACYCSGSPICSSRECCGVLFGRFRVCDSVEVEQVGPSELRLCIHARESRSMVDAFNYEYSVLVLRVRSLR
jgi:hypothetical protein